MKRFYKKIKHFFSNKTYAPNRAIKDNCVIPVFKNGLLLANTQQQYQSALGVNYTCNLLFPSKKIYFSLQKRTKKAIKKGLVSRQQKWLGSFFDQEMHTGKVPAISIHWIHEDLGFGVFAEKTLPKHTFIGEYTGHLRKKSKHLDEKNSYGFAYMIGESEETKYTIDAKVYGNHTRFLNHQENGNCAALLVLDRCNIMRVIILTEKKVVAGEQLTYDYGIDYWEKREDLHLL